MFNLLGDMPQCANPLLLGQTTSANVHWHDYHKTARADRKIGHVTVTEGSEAGLWARAAQLAGELGVAAELNLEAVMQGMKSRSNPADCQRHE